MPDVSRRFDAVRRALFAEFAKVAVAGSRPIEQLALSPPQALGNIIPEAWAIISEILAFYDVLITQDLFIRSATTRVALQQLSDLLGYLPRPAVAAETHIALVGSQSETPTSTLGLTLRASLPSPQVFEPDQIKTLSWIPRTATIAPIRDTIVSLNESDDTVKILLARARPSCAPVSAARRAGAQAVSSAPLPAAQRLAPHGDVALVESPDARPRDPPDVSKIRLDFVAILAVSETTPRILARSCR